jgi:hypothetical protein
MHQHANSHIRTHGHARSHSMPQASASPHHHQNPPAHVNIAGHGGIVPEAAMTSTALVPEGEQKVVSPELFGLESYYWNDYHQQLGFPAAQQQQHIQHYYPQDPSGAYVPQGDDGVVNGVIRRLWTHPYQQAHPYAQ